MKPTTFANGRFLLVLLTVILTVGLVSWGHQQNPGHYQQSANDTTPKKKFKDGDKKIQDLDDVLDQLNSVDIEREMQNAKAEIEKAMKNFDGDKIKMELDKAMKEVDMEKIQKEVQESLASVDFKKIKEQVAEAMKSVDMEKIQAQIEESMSKIDYDKMKKELDKVKEIDMSKLEVDMKKLGEEMKELGPKLEKEMGKAKEELQKAKEEIKEYKSFVDGLENDGLINKKEGYKLKHKGGELLINGKKASEQTYSKYRSFLEKHKKFTIDKSDDDFNIDMD